MPDSRRIRQVLIKSKLFKLKEKKNVKGKIGQKSTVSH